VALTVLVVTGCAPDGVGDADSIVNDADDESADDGAAPAANDARDEDSAEHAGPDSDDAAGPTASGDDDDAGSAADTAAPNGVDDDADGDGNAQGEVRVSIGDFFFDADDIPVEVGDTVMWSHNGRITHNVTARDGSFVSDNLAAGEMFSHTFDTAGEFVYVCTLHSQMVATVQVG
jgi:plastocyanin